MSKEFSGFQKSAPANLPITREEAKTNYENAPNSAWDIDLSPFHRIVNEQSAISRQIVAQLEETNEKIRLLSESLVEKDKGQLLSIISEENKNNKVLLEKQMESQLQMQYTIQQLEQRLIYLQQFLIKQQDLPKEISLNNVQMNSLLSQQERIFSTILNSSEKIILTNTNVENNIKDLKNTLEFFFKEQRIHEKQGNIIFWIFVIIAALFLLFLKTASPI